VIISDVMMPVMDGWTFVQRLRQDPRLSAIPVIVLTALGKDEARLNELGLGAEDFLAKPFRFDDLEKRVASALGRSGSAPVHVPPGAAVPARPVATPGHATPAPGSLGPPGIAAGGFGQGYPAHPYAGYPGYLGYPQGGYPNYPGYPPPEGAPAGGGPAWPTPVPNPDPHGVAPLSAPPTTGEVKKPGSGSFPAQRRTTALNGRLEQLGLSSLLVMMEMERKDGVLTLKQTDSTDIGRIFMRRGQVICAKLDERPALDGRECVYEMLRWKQGTFSFNAMEVDMDDSVCSSTTHLLMEGARLIDEANRNA
jgi:hypothetical protein